jgi:hypothetical protein
LNEGVIAATFELNLYFSVEDIDAVESAWGDVDVSDIK